MKQRQFLKYYNSQFFVGLPVSQSIFDFLYPCVFKYPVSGMVNGDKKPEKNVSNTTESAVSVSNSSRSSESFNESNKDTNNSRNHDHHVVASTSTHTSSTNHKYQHSSSSEHNGKPSTNGHNHHHHASSNHRSGRKASPKPVSNSLDKSLQAISDDDEPGPPAKKMKPVLNSQNGPLDGAELISDDESPSTTKDGQEEKPLQDDRVVPISDNELASFINDVFVSKVRVSEVELIDEELRRLMNKQREVEKESYEIAKDQITARQLFTNLQIERISIEARSQFPKEQAEQNSGLF